jgi:hypothetical protein
MVGMKLSKCYVSVILGKPSPRLDDYTLTREIMRLFKQDLSADQISGQFGALYPDRREKYFRQKQAKPGHRKGAKDHR